MQPHRPSHRLQGRFATLAITRIERYRRSPWSQRGACRFTPSCSHYAEEALRTRVFPVALLLVAWRLLRCNPFMHRRVADPVTRHRRFRLRPNTIPTVFSIMALSGFVVVVGAGVAEAVGVNGGCTATLNGRDPATLDSDHALVVHKGGSVQFTGTVPPSVASQGKIVSNTHIDVDWITGIGKVASSNHPGTGPQWGGTEAVDKYLKYSVGIYHVTGHASGTGGWSCDGDGYVELKDGSPLSKPVGGGAAGVTLVGLLGAAYASRASKPDTGDASYDDSEPLTPHDADTHDEAVQMENAITSSDPKVNAAAGLACLALIVIAIGVAFLSKDVAAGAVGAGGISRNRSRRIWSHGHPIMGFISGLLLGIGATVLLQQYAVWPLTIVTAIVFPIVTAVICALRAWLGKAYKFGPAT